MTIPVSTVPAVSAYLLNAIKSAIAIDPLAGSMLVKLGAPTKYLPNDIFVIGEVRRTVDPMAFVHDGGANFLQEIYDITVSISTWIGSGDSDDGSTTALSLNERAWQLVAYLETAVRQDPSLGDLVMIAYPKESTTTGPVWTANPTGLKVAVDVPIHVETAI